MNEREIVKVSRMKSIFYYWLELYFSRIFLLAQNFSIIFILTISRSQTKK